MSEQIFVLRENDELVTLEAADYPAEEILQALLARYPNLLPSSRQQEDGSAPWLLVAREASIPNDNQVETFALDHLFLDWEGVPTLVEVKRASDTRARREVVAQMLDYASHFVVHWTSERVYSQYIETCNQEDEEPDDRLQAFLGDTSADEFWQRVKNNLLAGRIRMIFVADRIRPELRRIVEFLNNQMDPAEVLAVEIPQYVGEGISTFVPRLVGQSVAAQERKSAGSGSPKRQWDESSFLEDIENRNGPKARLTAKSLLDWAVEQHLTVWWGRGAVTGSFVPREFIGDDKHFTFACYSQGYIELYFKAMQNRQPFGDITMREELLNRLNSIEGINLPNDTDTLSRRPTISIDILQDIQRRNQFLEVWDWYLSEVRKANKS